jgi:GTP-binding protein Era
MQSASFKAGFAVILGRPNVGKSTLLNTLLKTRLSIISPKPQTTRHKILGILDGSNYQLCLLDTPGLIKNPRDFLQNALRRTAQRAAHEDADVIVLLTEPRRPTRDELDAFIQLRIPKTPLILAINKIDLSIRTQEIEEAAMAYTEALKPEASFRISAQQGTGIEELLREIVSRLPGSPPFYERGILSDRWERFFVAEIIREQVFSLYGEEIPHATAVAIDEFKENSGGRDWLRAILYIEKDSQKGILIGHKGKALELLRNKSRQAMESFLGRSVDIELWVKVRKNWRKDPRSLKEFGYIP